MDTTQQGEAALRELIDGREGDERAWTGLANAIGVLCALDTSEADETVGGWIAMLSNLSVFIPEPEAAEAIARGQARVISELEHTAVRSDTGEARLWKAVLPEGWASGASIGRLDQDVCEAGVRRGVALALASGMARSQDGSVDEWQARLQGVDATRRAIIGQWMGTWSGSNDELLRTSADVLYQGEADSGD